MYTVQCTVLYTVYVYNLCNYCILMQADFQHVFINTNDVISYTIIRVLSFAIENNNKKINILYVSFLILVNMRVLQDKKNDAKKLDFFVIVVIQAFFVDENYVV